VKPTSRDVLAAVAEVLAGSVAPAVEDANLRRQIRAASTVIARMAAIVHLEAQVLADDAADIIATLGRVVELSDGSNRSELAAIAARASAPSATAAADDLSDRDDLLQQLVVDALTATRRALPADHPCRTELRSLLLRSLERQTPLSPIGLSVV
jgi:hypothetical protein